MRDPYREKTRDYRRMRKSRLNPGLFKLFWREYPLYNPHDNHVNFDDRQTWDKEREVRLNFFTKKTKSRNLAVTRFHDTPPKDFRQSLNRIRRRIENRAVSKAMRINDWDNVVIPRFRHDIAAWYF